VSAPDFDYREMVKCVAPVPARSFDAVVSRRRTPEQLLEVVAGLRLLAEVGVAGRFPRIPEVLAKSASTRSQSFAVADEGKSEEYVRLISDYYKTQPVPPGVLAAKDEALSNAYILTPVSHIRSKRYLLGLKKLTRVIPVPEESLRPHGQEAHVTLNHRQDYAEDEKQAVAFLRVLDVNTTVEPPRGPDPALPGKVGLRARRT